MAEPRHPSPPPEAVMMQFLNGMVVSRGIGLAAELGVADLLREGPRTAASLAEATRSQPDALYRLLRMLAGFGIFAEQEGREFVNTPLSDVLREDAPTSLRHYARWLCTDLHWRVLGNLDHAVRTGEPAILKEHPGKAPFEVLFGDPAAVIFDQAMTDLSLAEVPAILGAYDFSTLEHVIDVGGGEGYLAAMIATEHPRARLTVFDRPDVVEQARSRIVGKGLTQRVDLVAGDFLEETIPGPADLCILKHIVHGFGDEDAVRILGNCRGALREGGRILVCEMLITTGPESVPARVLDIEMLNGPGGRERTEGEYAALFERAGFRLERVIPTRSPLRLLEGPVGG